jgi:hypothetical protein
VDIERDIRVLRAIEGRGSCKLRDLVEMRIGNTNQTGAAVGRLRRAGLVVDDGRHLSLTRGGQAALGRLDDQQTRRRVLSKLIYGTRPPPLQPP